MSQRIFPVCVSCLALLLQSDAAFPGDDRKIPEVRVTLPVRREVTDYFDFTGRTEAVVRVELRARVNGYLLKAAFKEDQEVQRGDVLFEIDPRPYNAELDRAEARVVLADVRFKVAGGLREEAQAAIRDARGALEIARLNQSFTRVTAPCDGVIGRGLLSPGNLVTADETVLARIVGMDPMYVTFGMDEATLLRLRRMVNEGKLKPARDGKWPVSMGLTGENGHPHQGVMEFMGNEVNPATSAITLRAVFPNPRPANGVRMMTPGMLARIRMPVGEPHAALLVPQWSIIDLKAVYVVDD
jgi:multidrug efflux system membrane fusion protein